MSSLKARLDALRQQGGAAVPARTAGASMAQRLERMRCGRTDPRATGVQPDVEALAAMVGGTLEPGGFVRVERMLPWGERHGEQHLRRPRVMQFVPGVRGLDPSDWVFVDTETSGLAGGTGTVPFLCGFARFEAEGLRLRQYLLGSFGAEGAMLRALLDAIGPSPALVTYNGKSFDLPLLRDRLRLCGLGGGVGEAAHFDLLHAVRRAFRDRWPDCRLGTLEQRLLGHRRIDDIPGAEVPEVWFGYLHQGATGRMADVVRHNQEDLIALALALPELDATYADPARRGADLRQVAAAHQQTGAPEHAFAILAGAEENLCDTGKLDYAEHLRRRGEWSRACLIWEELAERGCVQAVERLAKYHEHVRRDWQRALSFAARLPSGQGRSRRIARLNAKLTP